METYPWFIDRFHIELTKNKVFPYDTKQPICASLNLELNCHQNVIFQIKDPRFIYGKAVKNFCRGVMNPKYRKLYQSC